MVDGCVQKNCDAWMRRASRRRTLSLALSLRLAFGVVFHRISDVTLTRISSASFLFFSDSKTLTRKRERTEGARPRTASVFTPAKCARLAPARNLLFISLLRVQFLEKKTPQKKQTLWALVSAGRTDGNERRRRRRRRDLSAAAN